MNEKIVAIDFDGKIVKKAWPEIGEFKPYAKSALKNIKKAGWIMILDTCRTGKYLKEAIDFLESNGIYFDLYNENHPERIKLYGSDCRKISADYYIDDQQLFGGNVGWPETENRLLSIYNKNK